MTATQKEIKSLKDDIDQIKTLLVDQIEETPSNGQSKTMLTREEIAGLANKAGQSVRSFVGQKSEQFHQARDVCESKIKERPFLSTAAAFAGGALLVALMKRK